MIRRAAMIITVAALAAGVSAPIADATVSVRQTYGVMYVEAGGNEANNLEIDNCYEYNNGKYTPGVCATEYNGIPLATGANCKILPDESNRPSALCFNVSQVRVSSGDRDDKINVVRNTAGNNPPPYNFTTDISTGSGDDTVSGGPTKDIVHGNENNDSILGNGGDDDLYGDAGQDGIDGGSGNDTIDGGQDTDDREFRDAGGARLKGLLGGDGDDTINGAGGDDVIAGGGQNDTISGGDNNDTIHGNNDVDTIHGNAGDDDIYGDAGDDWLHGDEDRDAILGDPEGTPYTDHIWGGDGNDTRTMRSGTTGGLDGGPGDDYIYGYAEGRNTCDSDLLHGRTGSDRLEGGCGYDQSYGDAGEDYLWSNTESDGSTTDTDVLNGGANNDHLYGANGRDTIDGDDSADALHAGNDEVWGAGGKDTIDGGPRDDNIHGGDEQGSGDSIHGREGNDTIDGEGGDDFLYGEAGVDSLYGGQGEDTIRGGADADHIWGGADSDYLTDLDRGSDSVAATTSSSDDFHGEGGDDRIETWDATCGTDKLPSASVKPKLPSCKGASADTVDCGSGDDSGWIADWMDNVDIAGTCERPFHAAAYIKDGTVVVDGGTASGVDGEPANSWYLRQERDLRTRIDDKAKYYIYAKPGSGCTYRSSGRVSSVYCSATASVHAMGEAGNDKIDGHGLSRYADRTLWGEGGEGDDTVYGSDQRLLFDLIDGGEGDDVLKGYDGNDWIIGGPDNDTITGGPGIDRMWGDTGSDWIKANESTFETDVTIDCGDPNPPDTQFDEGTKPENEDWVDLDIGDATRADNCENVAEPAPPPYQAPTLDDADL